MKDYSNSFVYENFTITSNGKTRKIIWSMEMGEIALTDFRWLVEIIC